MDNWTATVLSRINFLLENKKEDYTKPAFHMLKLNQKKIRWIVREVEKKELSVYQIAKIQKITPRHVRSIYKRFKNVKKPRLKHCGSKPVRITDEERNLVIDARKDNPLGAVNLETILNERGIHMPHNKIHRILRKEGFATEDPKKKNQRKWVRYERKHSNSLWHADYYEYNGRQILLIEDDASRMLVGYGVFDDATAENATLVMRQAIEKYGIPKQLMTDHGTHFIGPTKDECPDQKPTVFQELLKEYKIEHIKARVKHPQSNGKVERLVGTLKKHEKDFGSLEKAVEYYNFRRPHMSLYNGHTRTPYQAFLDKTWKKKGD